MDGAGARALEEAAEVDLAGLLERHDRPSFESASRSCSQGCFAKETPEGQLTDELRALLIAPNLHVSGRRRTLPGGLRLRR